LDYVSNFSFLGSTKSFKNFKFGAVTSAKNIQGEKNVIFSVYNMRGNIQAGIFVCTVKDEKLTLKSFTNQLSHPEPEK
jgi:hypothetical protein